MKRQCFLNVRVPVFPGVRALKLFVFVWHIEALQMSVEGAVVFDEIIIHAAINADGGQLDAIYVLRQGVKVVWAALRVGAEDAAQKMNALIVAGQVSVTALQRARMRNRRAVKLRKL